MNSMADQSATEPQLEVIDRQRALDLLDKALTERGEDYVYTAPSGDLCLYVYDGQPSCLVAHALVQHGVAVADLLYHEGGRASGLPWGDVDARWIFDAAQTAQDRGESWGSAVAAARCEAANQKLRDASLGEQS